MIRITGGPIQDFCTVLRKGLGITKRRHGPNIHVRADEQQLQIRAKTDEIVIQWTTAGEFLPTEFSAPFDLLRQIDGGRSTEVTWQVQDDQVKCRWSEIGIPKSYCILVESSEEFPEEPSNWEANGPELVQALADAAETADRESTRFALSYLCLRGREGRVAATDGRQLFAQTGFALPWEDDCLVPVRQLLTCACFLNGEKVEVGKLYDWVILRSGGWTVWLKINHEGRFPELDFLLRPSVSPVATLHLAESDAQFLKKARKHLPGGDQFHAAVTVDMNGKVALRTADAAAAKPTELVLVQSRREGAETCFAVDRRHLSRAVPLGFRQLLITSPEAPVICRFGNRSMVWAPLNQSAILKPVPDATRIASPSQSQSASQRHRVLPSRNGVNHRTKSARFEAAAWQSLHPAVQANFERAIFGLRDSLHQIASRVVRLERLLDNKSSL